MNAELKEKHEVSQSLLDLYQYFMEKHKGKPVARQVEQIFQFLNTL